MNKVPGTMGLVDFPKKKMPRMWIEKTLNNSNLIQFNYNG